VIHELRIYHAVPGRLPDLNKRFETITLKLWEKHGIRQAGFWTVLIGPNNHQLYYLVEWKDMAERELASLSWGLLPSWSKKSQGNRPINARAESLFEKPMFRNAIAKRRCLIPADGFYEWQQHPAGKQPWHIGMIDDKTFALGGIWEYWAIEGQEPVLSCAIIVTDANEMIRKLHERMPLIIAREDWDRWLDPALTDAAEIEQLLKPFPAEEMRAYPVSSRVNNVKNDDAGLIEPAGPAGV
jgi:putative SOS response-associated peptidase YedK